jgi:putative spermidine/putrescine transport system ATP-binding protein
MMFQSYALFPHQTVWQNVEFGLRMQGIAAPQRQARVGEMLDTLGLSALAQRKPARLSGGQQQRVALARLLDDNYFGG